MQQTFLGEQASVGRFAEMPSWTDVCNKDIFSEISVLGGIVF